MDVKQSEKDCVEVDRHEDSESSVGEHVVLKLSNPCQTAGPAKAKQDKWDDEAEMYGVVSHAILSIY